MGLELAIGGVVGLVIIGLIVWIVRLSRELGELKTEVLMHRAVAKEKTSVIDILANPPTEDEFLAQRRAKFDTDAKGKS